MKTADPLPSAADLRARIDGLLRLLSPLPDAALRPGERMTLGGSLFPEAPWVVELVAQALAAEPALFADVPLDAAALREEQDRALAYRQLRDALALLLRRASDGYALSQSRALRGAMSVVRQARADDERPFAHPQAAARAAALAPAERVLAARAPRPRRGRPGAADSAPGRLVASAARAAVHDELDALAREAAAPRPEGPEPPPPPPGR